MEMSYTYTATNMDAFSAGNVSSDYYYYTTATNTVAPEKNLTDVQRKRLTEQWEQRHQGVNWASASCDYPGYDVGSFNPLVSPLCPPINIYPSIEEVAIMGEIITEWHPKSKKIVPRKPFRMIRLQEDAEKS
jgi:hypothetical protein